MADVQLIAKVDITEVDEAIEKAQQLSKLLKEAKCLARDLASMDLNLDIKIGGEDDARKQIKT